MQQAGCSYAVDVAETPSSVCFFGVVIPGRALLARTSDAQLRIGESLVPIVAMDSQGRNRTP